MTFLLVSLAVVLTFVPTSVDAQGLPGVPGNVTVTMSLDNTQLAVRWAAPTTGAAPDGYFVEFQTAQGVPILSTPVAAPRLEYIVSGLTAQARGSYLVRVSAFVGQTLGPASPLVPFTIGATGPAPTSAPANFRLMDPLTGAPFPWNEIPPSRLGSTAALTWGAVPTATRYRISVRYSPTSPVILTMDAIASPLLVVAPISPGGRFCLSIAAVNEAGVGPVSAPLAVGLAMPPGDCVP